MNDTKNTDLTALVTTLSGVVCDVVVSSDDDVLDERGRAFVQEQGCKADYALCGVHVDDRTAGATRYVAAQLAYVALQHEQAAEELPNLTANAAEAIRNLYDAATALGFRAEFEAACARLEVQLEVRR